MTIIDRNEEVLRVLDPDVRNVILSDFKSKGISLITSANIDSFEQVEGKTLIKYFVGQHKKNSR